MYVGKNHKHNKKLEITVLSKNFLYIIKVIRLPV